MIVSRAARTSDLGEVFERERKESMEVIVKERDR
jgi:hypothetical protein